MFVSNLVDEDLSLPLGKKKLGLAAARQILVGLKEQRRAGICPAARIKEELARLKEEEQSKRFTVRDIVEIYLSQHIEDHHSLDGKTIIPGVIKRKGQKETRRTLEAVTKTSFGQRLAVEITHVDVKNLISGIIANGSPVQAGRVLSELNLAFNYVIGRPEPLKGVGNENWLPYLPDEHVNPCLQAKFYFKTKNIKLSAKKADRVLDDKELKLFLDWLPGSKFSAITKHALMITLYTGVRSGEAVAIEKSKIDLTKGTWLLNETKTGISRYVQLSIQINQYIQPLLDNPDNKTPYLLPSSRTGKPQWQKQLSEQAWQLRKKGNMLDIPNWTAHDLRRTCGTGLSRLGCPNEVAEAVLGHGKKGLEGTYNLYEYEKECAVWLQKWADHLDILMGHVPNVISIKNAI